MKKKLLSLGMAAALSLSLLSGCGGDTTPSGTPPLPAAAMLPPAARSTT